MRPGDKGKEVSGVLVVDKPEGPTSFEVVRRIKKALGIKKVGHTGTLDPLATGVLPLCFNRATKLVPFLQAGEKEYQGRMILGLSTDTEDVTGRVTAKRALTDLSLEEIRAATREFVGLIEQVPPAFSAVKHGGWPAHRLARAGLKVPAKSRKVTVHDLVVTSVDMPRVCFYIRVSKGTYIRSLVSDIGRRLKTGACLEGLRRLSSAPFTIDEALTLEEALGLASEGRLEERFIPADEALSFMPKVRVSEGLVHLVENGQPLPLGGLEGYVPRPGPVRVMTQGAGLLAVYEYKDPAQTRRPDCLTPIRVLGRN